MKIVTKHSEKKEMFLVRHMNGSLCEAENIGEAEFKVVYDGSNHTFLWTVSIFNEAFTDFVPMTLVVLEKEQPRFMKAIYRLIQMREEKSQFVAIKTRQNDEPNPAA